MTLHRDAAEIALVAGKWRANQLTVEEKRKYVKTEPLRTRVWPHNQRASNAELYTAFQNLPAEDRAGLYEYAFDSSGQPYAEYAQIWGIPRRQRAGHAPGLGGPSRASDYLTTRSQGRQRQHQEHNMSSRSTRALKREPMPHSEHLYVDLLNVVTCG